jgi:hypothetical protein
MQTVLHGYAVSVYTATCSTPTYPLPWSSEVALHRTVSLLNLLCGLGNFGKIWPACEQHELQHAELRMNKYRPV